MFGSLIVSGQDGTDVVVAVEWLEFDDGLYNVEAGVFTPTEPPLPLVSVVATDGAGTEASVQLAGLHVTFARTGDTSQALTVNYSIFPAPVDGAQPGSDFPAQSGTITFAAGSATAVLSFDAIDDALVENTELFSVVVGVGAGYEVDIPNATAGASIVDNDVAPVTADYSWTTLGVTSISRPTARPGLKSRRNRNAGRQHRQRDRWLRQRHPARRHGGQPVVRW